MRRKVYVVQNSNDFPKHKKGKVSRTEWQSEPSFRQYISCVLRTKCYESRL